MLRYYSFYHFQHSLRDNKVCSYQTEGSAPVPICLSQQTAVSKAALCRYVFNRKIISSVALFTCPYRAPAKTIEILNALSFYEILDSTEALNEVSYPHDTTFQLWFGYPSLQACIVTPIFSQDHHSDDAR